MVFVVEELVMPSYVTFHLVPVERLDSMNVMANAGKERFLPLLFNADVVNDSLIEPCVVKFCLCMPLFSVYVIDTCPPTGLWKSLWGNERMEHMVLWPAKSW